MIHISKKEKYIIKKYKKLIMSKFIEIKNQIKPVLKDCNYKNKIYIDTLRNGTIDENLCFYIILDKNLFKIKRNHPKNYISETIFKIPKIKFVKYFNIDYHFYIKVYNILNNINIDSIIEHIIIEYNVLKEENSKKQDEREKEINYYYQQIS